MSPVLRVRPPRWRSSSIRNGTIEVVRWRTEPDPAGDGPGRMPAFLAVEDLPVMKTTLWSGSRLLATCAGMGWALVVGCGGDDLAKRYPVSGTVTYKGETVSHGRIDFVPTKPPPEGRAASGAIVQGRYSLTTHSLNDGALPGSYKVIIDAQEYDPKAKEAMDKESGGRAAHLGSPAHIKVGKTSKPMVPAKYKLADTTDLKAEVKEQSNTIDFNLPD
jgi:hypothetical protein